MSSIYNGWLFWSVNHTSIFWNSELNAFKRMIFFEEMFDLFGANVYKTVESFFTILQWTNTSSVISKWGAFSPSFYFQWFQQFHCFRCSKLKIISSFNFKCISIFYFIFMYFYWWIINTFIMFFKNILQIILNMIIEYDPSGNSN